MGHGVRKWVQGVNEGAVQGQRQDSKKTEAPGSRLSAERVGSPGAESFWEGPHSSLEQTQRLDPRSMMTKRIHPVAQGWHSQGVYNLRQSYRGRVPKSTREVEIVWGIKTVTVHTAAALLQALEMPQWPLYGDGGSPVELWTCLTILLWYPCLPVPFQPLAVRPGDGRWWHREYQPCPPEVSYLQLRQFPTAGVRAWKSLFQVQWVDARQPGAQPRHQG